MPSAIDDLKRAARTRAHGLRAALDPVAAGAALARHVLACAGLPSRIAGYWPRGGEIDIRPLLYALHARGHQLLLPQTPPRGNPLIFRHWSPDAALLAERFGGFYPDGAVAEPELLLVPLLAFDAAGHRLGYGGGYYDRTLAGLPGARSIGCAFAAQEVAELPVDAHDRRLDAVATELGLRVMPRDTPWAGGVAASAT